MTTPTTQRTETTRLLTDEQSYDESYFAHNELVDSIITLALREDIGRGDTTTLATVPATAQARAIITQKSPGVLCGLPLLSLVYKKLDQRLHCTALEIEGSWGERRVVAQIEGPARAILTGERTVLNMIARLSGIATMSRRAAEIVAGTGVLVLDTRKTSPGLRVLEKYAVRIGGAHNHRAGLDDGILIKENHIRAAGGIRAAIMAARAVLAPMQQIEIEVTTLDELDEAISAGAAVILVDNAELGVLRAAVSRARRAITEGFPVRLEASGGVRLENLKSVAQTGVDYISLGALTHSAGNVDFSLTLS